MQAPCPQYPIYLLPTPQTCGPRFDSNQGRLTPNHTIRFSTRPHTKLHFATEALPFPQKTNPASRSQNLSPPDLAQHL